MVNSALDFIKKQQRKLDNIEFEAELKELVDESGIDHLAYEDLLAMVRRLPVSYRTVFNLHAIEGYGHQEIAEMLGTSEGTSKSNFHKAKKKLQDMLKVHFDIGK